MILRVPFSYDLRFGTLGAVLGAALLTVLDATGIEGAANDVIANAGEILDAAATDQHDGVFLEVVAFAGDVGGDFDAIGEAHAGDLTESGIRLLGSGRVDTSANSATLRAGLERRTGGLITNGLTALTH
jgi:hypothetical protein